MTDRPTHPARSTLAAIALAAIALVIAAPVAAQSLCLCLRCALLTHRSYVAPGSSMEPTLMTDACFEGRYLRDGDTPPPGSVVTFVHPVSGLAHVSRVVAEAGQRVQMIDGVLRIDGQPVGLSAMPPFDRVFEAGRSGHMPRCPQPVAAGTACAIDQYAEMLPNGARYRILDLDPSSAIDNTAEILVPPGHVFVLGDNRDNSVDSRIPARSGGVGPVPLDALITIVDDPETLLE